MQSPFLRNDSARCVFQCISLSVLAAGHLLDSMRLGVQAAVSTNNSMEPQKVTSVCFGPTLTGLACGGLLLMTGKSKHHGKNKRKIKPANHGARPCNHTGRHARRPRRGKPFKSQG